MAGLFDANKDELAKVFLCLRAWHIAKPLFKRNLSSAGTSIVH